MLEETLVALAAAGGTAVVQAAGTDAWIGFRTRMAKLLGRGDAQRERAELARLDQMAASLEAADPSDAERLRLRHESSWQVRLEILLEDLGSEQRSQAVTELRHLVHSVGGSIDYVSAGTSGLAVGGNLEIAAGHGSVAAAIINGDVSLGDPHKLTPPAPPQDVSTLPNAAGDGRSAWIHAAGHSTAIGEYHAAPESPDPGKTQKAAEMEHARRQAAAGKAAYNRFISAMPRPNFTEIEWRERPRKGRLNRLLNDPMFEPVGLAYVAGYVDGTLQHIRSLTSSISKLYELSAYLATLSRPGWMVDPTPRSTSYRAYPVHEVDHYIAELRECLNIFFTELAQE
jgi:hypothetical protein